MNDAIGWASSLILLVTICKQVYDQWHAGTSAGVSQWLFLGQIAASIGFALYSWQIRNWIFVATNLLLIVSAALGYAIVLRHQRLAGERRRRRGTHSVGSARDLLAQSHEAHP